MNPHNFQTLISVLIVSFVVIKLYSCVDHEPDVFIKINIPPGVIKIAAVAFIGIIFTITIIAILNH